MSNPRNAPSWPSQGRSSDSIAAPGNHTQLGGISPRSNTFAVTSCFAQVAQECAVIPGVRLYMHKSIGLGLSWLGLRRSWTRATSSVPSAGIPGNPAATTAGAGVFARSGGRRGELHGQVSVDKVDDLRVDLRAGTRVGNLSVQFALWQISCDLTSCVHPECDALWMHR